MEEEIKRLQYSLEVTRANEAHFKAEWRSIEEVYKARGVLIDEIMDRVIDMPELSVEDVHYIRYGQKLSEANDYEEDME